MLLGDLDLPDKVLDAHASGKLVVFTGAGISIPDPSGLPGFFDLAKKIVAKTHFPVTPNVDAYEDRIDYLLGLLDDDPEIDVHDLVRAEIDLDGSRPSTLHRDIIRIARASTARIITTNFDLHLSTAAKALEFDLRRFDAPALPVGDDFEGLTYLHGAISQPSKQLVITDSDFGCAYMTDAWAARFLERMFREYVVLFVGYGHTDPVMTYLGRALGRNNQNRFVLTHAPDADRWKRLGINTIAYSDANRHEALAIGLEAWAKHVEMGLLDHKHRIQELVGRPSEPTPSEASYLEESLRHPQRVRLFVEAARDPFWLEWAATREPFRGLFDRRAQPTDALMLMADWFVDRFALVEPHHRAALYTVSDAGGGIGDVLWNAIGLGLHRGAKPRPLHYRPWLRLLMDSDHSGYPSDLLDYALVGSSWPQDRAEVLDLFEHLVQPVARWRASGMRVWSSVDVAPRGDEHWLQESWNTLLRPNLVELAPDLLAIACRSIQRHHLVVGAYESERRSDWLSYRRQGIEIRGAHSEAIDVVIDVARDSLAQIEETDPSRAHQLIDDLLKREERLLRRLGVHALANATSYTPGEKLAQAMDAGFAADRGVQHEWFMLVASCVGSLNADEISRLVSVACDQNDGTERGVLAAVDLLEWMEQNGVSDRVLSSRLLELRAILPSRSSGEAPRTVNPIATPQTLHELIVEDSRALVANLLEHSDGIGELGSESPWARTLAIVSETVRAHPEDGFVLLEILSQSAPLRARVITAWASANGQRLQTRIVRALRTLTNADDREGIERFLDTLAEDAPRQDKWFVRSGVHLLAKDLWAMLPDEDANRPTSDWMTLALNHPVSTVTRLWLARIGYRWRSAGTRWSGLGRTEKQFLGEMLLGRSFKSQVATTLLAARLHYLDGADPGWCRDNLLRQFVWGTGPKAFAAWTGFLSSGRWNNRLLAAGLLDGLIETAVHLAEFDSGQQRRWAELMCYIAIQADLPPEISDWVPRFTRVTPEHHRVEWLCAIGDCLRELPPNAVEFQWNSWIRGYWVDRLSNVPSVLSKGEASVMATWITSLPLYLVPDACQLARQAPAALVRSARFVDLLADEAILAYPQEVGGVLTHLMRGTDRLDWAGYMLAPKLRLLVAQDGDWSETKQVALGLGIDLEGTPQ